MEESTGRQEAKGEKKERRMMHLVNDCTSERSDNDMRYFH